MTITAAYGGGSGFAASSGSVTVCANGSDLDLESVRWVGRHDHGFEIGHEAVITGCGLAAGDEVRWGNDLATETLTAGDVNAEGTSATTTVPWNATSGKFSVTDGQTTATLTEEQTVDTWRNTEGFSFENYSTFPTRQEMVDAFAEPILTPEGTLPPAYEAFYRKQLAFADKDGLGRCYGFAVLTSEFGDGSVNPDSFGTAATPFGLSKDSVEDTIGIDWWKQYAREARPYRRASSTQGEIRAALEAAFGPNGFTHPAVFAFEWLETEKTPKGVKSVWQAHAVTAFALRDDYPHTGEFTIYTYNSNIPLQEGEKATDGVLHNKAQTNSEIVIKEDGEWSAPGEGTFAHGVAERLTIVPAAVFESPVHLARAQRTATTFVSAGTGVASVTSPTTGAPVNLQAGGSAGVALSAQADGTTPLSSTYAGPGVSGVSAIEGPEGDWKETLGGSGASGLGAVWLGGLGGAALEAPDGFAAIDFNSATGALALSPAAGQPSPAKAGLQLYSTYTAGAPEHVLTLSGPLVTAGIKASFTGSGGVQISSSGAATLRVELSISGRGTSSQTFDLGTVSLPKGATFTASPSSWSSLATARLSARLSAGRHSRRLRFKNRLHAPRTKILTRSLSGGTRSAGLKLLLGLPALDPKQASVTISAIAKHGAQTVAKATATVALTGARRQTAALTFTRALPRGSKVTVTVETATGGTTPSSSKTSATIAAR